jgi:hypothetical protein
MAGQSNMAGRYSWTNGYDLNPRIFEHVFEWWYYFVTLNLYEPIRWKLDCTKNFRLWIAETHSGFSFYFDYSLQLAEVLSINGLEFLASQPIYWVIFGRSAIISWWRQVCFGDDTKNVYMHIQTEGSVVRVSEKS